MRARRAPHSLLRTAARRARAQRRCAGARAHPERDAHRAQRRRRRRGCGGGGGDSAARMAQRRRGGASGAGWSSGVARGDRPSDLRPRSHPCPQSRSRSLPRSRPQPRHTHTQASLSLRLKLAAGQAVVLVPSLATADEGDVQQGDDGRSGDYMVRVWCDGPCTLRWLPPLRRTSMRGHWSAGDPLHGGYGASAGGLLARTNVPLLAAAGAATRRFRSPPTCSGRSARPERRGLAAWLPTERPWLRRSGARLESPIPPRFPRL